MEEQIEVPGEHYQLDMEMSFVEQEDIFKVVEQYFTIYLQNLGMEEKLIKIHFKITYQIFR